MKIIDNAVLDAVSAAARQSPRLRMNHNLHPSDTSACHRFFNAIEPGASTLFREFATGMFPAGAGSRVPVRAVDILELEGAALNTALVLRAKQAADAGAW